MHILQIKFALFYPYMIPVSCISKFNIEWQGTLRKPILLIACCERDFAGVKVEAFKGDVALLRVCGIVLKVHVAVDKAVEAEAGVGFGQAIRIREDPRLNVGGCKVVGKVCEATFEFQPGLFGNKERHDVKNVPQCLNTWCPNVCLSCVPKPQSSAV